MPATVRRAAAAALMGVAVAGCSASVSVGRTLNTAKVTDLVHTAIYQEFSGDIEARCAELVEEAKQAKLFELPDLPTCIQSLRETIEEIEVSCPEDVTAKAGHTFECTATDTSGDVRRVSVTQDDNKGNVTVRLLPFE